ncbi:MAG: hypothetical protein A2583_04255 [Bdellovibrionales bacterium RIFOXYD1_FULL_53_11]|nr:MAG: hypothetical protein A2583_04255 [Bdellovibrionales bacterium RIFOXYD1_FULL_53_11]
MKYFIINVAGILCMAGVVHAEQYSCVNSKGGDRIYKVFISVNGDKSMISYEGQGVEPDNLWLPAHLTFRKGLPRLTRIDAKTRYITRLNFKSVNPDGSFRLYSDFEAINERDETKNLAHELKCDLLRP